MVLANSSTVNRRCASRCNGFERLLGVHSRYGLHARAVTVNRDTLTEGFNHFVTSIAAPVASGWNGCRVGFAPTGERRLCTQAASAGCLLPRPWAPAIDATRDLTIASNQTLHSNEHEGRPWDRRLTDNCQD